MLTSSEGGDALFSKCHVFRPWKYFRMCFLHAAKIKKNNVLHEIFLTIIWYLYVRVMWIMLITENKKAEIFPTWRLPKNNVRKLRTRKGTVYTVSASCEVIITYSARLPSNPQTNRRCLPRCHLCCHPANLSVLRSRSWSWTRCHLRTVIKRRDC